MGTDRSSIERTGGGTTTEISDPASTPPDEAMADAIPTPTPDQTRFVDGATVESSECQAKGAAGMGWPFASSASAEARTDPRRISVNASGRTRMAATFCSTVISAVPSSAPAEAVTAVTPLPTAVTNPAASTPATEASPLVHAIAVPVMACPYWSSTVAESCTVSPRE